MTVQEKCIKIIEELELSARQIAVAIDKSPATVAHKIKQIKSNKFLEDDFKNLKNYYVKKLEKIKKIT